MFDKGVPKPKFASDRDWHFGEMEIDDSFAVEPSEAAGVRKAASNWKKRHDGWNYATAFQTDGTLRLWCLAVPVVEAVVKPVHEPFYSTESTWAELEARQEREALEAKNKSET